MKNFQFDGKARNYFFVGIAAFLITGLTAGIALPWAVTMIQRWKTSHTLVEGRRLRFYGSGGGAVRQIHCLVVPYGNHPGPLLLRHLSTIHQMDSGADGLRLEIRRTKAANPSRH